MVKAGCCLVLALVSFVGCGVTDNGSAPRAGSRPNILLIVADDLGYTDLGVYGGEIRTPRLDALARSGLMFTGFHAAATCSPTRAMLLSGIDNHLAGLGTMAGDQTANQQGQPGYEGYLNHDVISLATLLRDAGYRTYMTGKWHLGLEDATSPTTRGFDRSFALLPGGAGHFDAMGLFSARPAPFRENGALADLPEDFYSTRFYATRLTEYIEQDRRSDRPFFAYLAFTAPHWPLQAPGESIARYAGLYDDGYDALHTRRFERMKDLGLVPAGAESAPRSSGQPAWVDLDDEQRRVEARKMEIYAAMVDDLDQEVGNLVDYLERTGQLEDTFILFMSDNGPEGHDLQATWPQLAEYLNECCDQSYENMGNRDSYVYYGPNWARAGAAPFRLFKGYSTQGGLVVPAFVRYPGMPVAGSLHHDFVSVLDVMPTLLELAGVEHPGTLQGRSMLPLLRGESDRVHEPDHVMGWELFGRRAIRHGQWKLVWTTAPQGPERWQLFDLQVDPAELHDLSGAMPRRRDALIALWERYAAENNVILPDAPIGY